MTTSPIYLTEADVARLVTVKDAIATLEELFATWGQPSTVNLPRQRARLAGGAFNLMGAAYGAKGVHGLKAYAGLKGGQYHTLLYSSSDGKLNAMIEADLFGQTRTGAVRSRLRMTEMRFRIPATHCARGLLLNLLPSLRAPREDRCSHPRSRVRFAQNKVHTSIQGQR